jgi:hypothetical protein
MTESKVNQVPSGLDRTQIRQIRANDLPALEWEGEFTHFRLICRGLSSLAARVERALAG